MSAKTLLAAFASLTVLGLAAGANAAPAASDPDTVAVKVNYADLDLSSRADTKIALLRIRNAAGAICGEAPDPRLLDRASEYQACMTTTVDRAVAALGSPLVASLIDRPVRPTALAANSR